MKNNVKYWLVGVLVFVVSFVFAAPYFAARTLPYVGGYGMGPMMMGGWGMHGGFGWFGGPGMLAMGIFPLLLLGLIVAGIVWAVRSSR